MEGTKFTIIRNEIPDQLTSDVLLVGDLISITYGNVVAADLVWVERNGIKMDESALIGEFDLMKKEPYKNV